MRWSHKDGLVNARKRGCSLMGLSSPFVFVSPARFPVAEKGLHLILHQKEQKI